MRIEEQLYKIDTPEEEFIDSPVQSAEKKSVEAIHLDDFRGGKKKRGEYNINREYNVKEKILDRLKDENIFIETNGHKVFDFEKFSEFLFSMTEIPRNITIAQGKQTHLSKSAIFEALRDLSVISRAEYLNATQESKDIKEKPLFNIPESAGDAFDVDTIKTKDYYLNYWDIFGSVKEKQVNWNNDMVAQNGDLINMKEFAFATKLFKDFQAIRTSDGELQVFDKTKGAHIKVGVDWVRENLGSFGSHEAENSVHNFLLKNCPNVLTSGLIRLSDFQTKTESASGKLIRAEKFVSSVKPEVMIGGVKYYIGRDTFKFQGQSIPTENIKIAILDQNTAGVILINGGQEKVYCLIDLLSIDEKKKIRDGIRDVSDRPLKEKEVTARSFLNKKDVNGRVHAWRRTEDNPKFENETPEEYAERMSSIADYGYIKKVTEDFALQAGLGIHNLSWREQQWLVSAAFDLKSDYPKLLEFGKTYGIDGLKTFLSCEYGLEHGKEILCIGEKLSPETASAIFAKYNEIASAAENNVQELVKNYIEKVEGAEDQEYQKTVESLLKKSKDLLLNFSEKLKTNKKVDEGALLQELEKTKTDAVFLTSILKTFAKENSDMSFENFKGLSFETTKGKNFENEQDISQMVSIAQKNYASNEAMQKLVIESLQEGFENENSQFYILRHNGEIVAFCRFDNEGDHFYAGSFNVDPDYRGSAIGEVMMRESLDKKAQEKPVHAITDPKKIICSKYIEDEGFVIDEILYTEFEGRVLEEVNIVRDDKKNKAYEYRVRYRPADIALAYNKQQHEIKDGNKSRSIMLRNKQSFIASFDKEQEIERFLKLSEKLMKEYGYVITRYLPADKEGKKMFATFEQKL